MSGNVASRKTKIKEKRGFGTGAEYKPYIKAREVPSLGTCTNIIDWKHGRIIQTLSEREAMLYYILRWDDQNVDLREQYPLDLETTNLMAEKHGIIPPFNGKDNMTTDILATRKDGSLVAWSLKDKRDTVANHPRTIEKLYIEKLYWGFNKVEWHLVYKEDLNPIYADNIRLCTEFYDRNKVFDDVSLLKHMIAVKKISVDMKSSPILFGRLVKETPYKEIIRNEREPAL